MEHITINNQVFNKDLSHTEFRVLVYLISRYDTKLGYASPTRKIIASECNMNDNTVGRVLNQLEDKGYIKRDKIKRNRCMSNIYYLEKKLI